MIDVHTHILPSIDDGSKSIDETYNLIKEAKQAGFDEIILTPHYIEGYYKADEEKRKKLIEEIQENAEVKLYIGNEVYMTENIKKLLKDKKISTLNNTKYILFEMPMNIKPMSIYEVVYEMLENKLVPILAHPERYSFVIKEPELIYELIQKGVLMQANYGSIIGIYGKKSQVLVKKLLKNDMIHFLGTDVHKEKSIYKKMPKILKKLRKVIGEEKLEELSMVNPKKVLNNKKIEISNPVEFEYTVIEKIMMSQ